jgi:hypothetical protein
MTTANPAIFSSVVAQSLFNNTLGEEVFFGGGAEKPFTGLTPEQIEQGEAIDPGFNIGSGSSMPELTAEDFAETPEPRIPVKGDSRGSISNEDRISMMS